MPPTLTLDITPQSVGEDEELTEIVHTLHDTLPISEVAIYSLVQDDSESLEIFLAQNPDRALRWICQQTPRAKLLRLIRHIYKDVARNDNDENSVQDTALDNIDEPSVQGTKRKRPPKENTTRVANQVLVNKMNLDLVQTVASTQDWEYAKAPQGLSNEEQKYRNFAKKLPGVGVNAVTQMINKAVAVGTMEVFRDWQAILAVWKRQNHYGKKLFQTVVVPLGDPATQGGFILQDSSGVRGGNVVVFSSPHDQQEDEAGLTALETETFRYKYFDAQKTRVDGMADDMRHRWKMDELYEEYDRLEKEIKKRNRGTGARGIRYADRAKEHLFGSTYKRDLGRLPTKATDPDLWTAFGDQLDWGKRWNVLKKRFGGVGIFALLPRSLVPNAFVEKTLTQTRLSQWADMVAECNKDVVEMAARIEPLFLACMEESEPPPEFAFLENLDGYPRTTRPFALFLG
jgi:hypothetical protein